MRAYKDAESLWISTATACFFKKKFQYKPGSLVAGERPIPDLEPVLISKEWLYKITSELDFEWMSEYIVETMQSMQNKGSRCLSCRRAEIQENELMECSRRKVLVSARSLRWKAIFKIRRRVACLDSKPIDSNGDYNYSVFDRRTMRPRITSRAGEDSQK